MGGEIGRAARALVGVLVLVSVVGVAGAGPSHAGPTGSGAQSCTPRRAAESGTTDRTVQQDGLERRYQLTIPQGYTGRKAAPLVVNLHGFGGTGASQDTLTDMPKLAADRGYVVVSPDGGPLKVPIGLVPGAEGAGEFEGRPFWNIFGQGTVDFGPPRGQNLNVDSSLIGADDVSFITKLLETLERELCIDMRRVYATGMSNGAGMATTLACALGRRLAAIAPVAGVNLTGKCPGRIPTSVLAVHGDADDTVLYDGNGLLGFQFGNPSVRERMDQWAKRDGCRPRPVTNEAKPGLTVTRWRGCVKGVDVQLWTIAGWNHAWPRATSAGQPGVIDATKVALDFFDDHRR